MRNKIQGFTLIELMIVVAIISILAAIAMPAYQDYVIRGKLAEAYSQLASQRIKMEQFYQDNRSYGPGDPACSIANVAAGGQVKYFNYTCVTTNGGQKFVFTATGVVSGGTNGFVFTIDEDGNKSSTVDATRIAEGWASSPNCWIKKKNGEC